MNSLRQKRFSYIDLLFIAINLIVISYVIEALA